MVEEEHCHVRVCVCCSCGFLLIASASASAQATHKVGQPAAVKPSAEPLTKPSSVQPLALWRTILDSNINAGPATTSCDSADCVSFAPMFTEEVVCPMAEGRSCTFQITVESQNTVASNDGLDTKGENGLYQFLVDGQGPTPGPVDMITPGCACYSWSSGQANSGNAWLGTSYSVTANVTNTKGYQKHSIVVSIGCNEDQGDSSGCVAQSGFANLQVGVYTSLQLY